MANLPEILPSRPDTGVDRNTIIRVFNSASAGNIPAAISVALVVCTVAALVAVGMAGFGGE